jgi:chromosome segregation ATPase
MAVKAEEIRQAKKFLENKKVSIKKVKPRLFAQASDDIGHNFNELFNKLQKDVNGTADSSDQKKD